MKLFFSLLSLAFVLAATTSCSKCKNESFDGGEIIKDFQIRVIGHPYSPSIVRAQGTFGLEYEFSRNGGYLYEPVDFSQHSLLFMPVTASCNSGFQRLVTLNSTDKTVEYFIEVSECDNCETRNTTYNWVMVNKIPEDYTPIFKVDYK